VAGMALLDRDPCRGRTRFLAEVRIPMKPEIRPTGTLFALLHNRHSECKFRIDSGAQLKGMCGKFQSSFLDIRIKD